MIDFDSIVSLDFETKGIVDGGPLLPYPVGCAIKRGRGESVYYAWGHPTENNCTEEEFRGVIQSIWEEEWLTQNGATFDVPIAEHYFGAGLNKRDPLLTHDTLFMAYLHDPHARSLSLKDLAEDWLGMPPEEQQEMYDWLQAHVPECRRSRKACGAYISEAPGSMVGRYAIGDTDRTHALAEFLAPVLEHMPEAYNRERLLAPILADIQNRGVRCDLERLKADYAKAMEKKNQLEQMIRDHLKQGPEFEIKNEALGAAMLALGYEGFLTTPTGKVSMAAASLEKALESDPVLRSLLSSRSKYVTLTGTFMGPWIEYAEANGGRIHASYNQVRNPDGFGTRTGRLSSSKPNFQNVPTDQGVDHWGDPYPVMRSYLLPEEGHVWVCGDFKNQEPRITAHFEEGALMEAFQEDPNLDPYMFVANLCNIDRKPSKTILLGIIYAMGAPTMAEKLGIDVQTTTIYRNIIKANLPDVVQLDLDCKKRFRHGLPIKTLGGRLYYCEPPSNGRTWEYKALNVLVQGSAADQTKEAMVFIKPYLDKLGARLLGTVHDEYSISCKPEHVESIKKLMQMSANALPCDVPMLMDINHGASWAEAK